jgi:hypothetical protein
MLLLCAQTKAGNPAKAPTAQEIQDLVARIWIAIQQSPDLPEFKKYVGDDCQNIVWSFDNARVHTSAFEEWGSQSTSWNVQQHIPGYVVFPPAYSPDLHQVIEHAHANTVRLFQNWLYEQRNVAPASSVMSYMHAVDRCFKLGNPKESVCNNVKKLHAKVYDAVLANGGDYIPSALR